MVSLLAGLAMFLASCCEDCPTCPNGPEPYKGWLYAVDYWHGWVYQIDIETDSLVDSVCHELGTYDAGAIDVSQDGRYLAVVYRNALGHAFTRIYDAQTLEVIIDLDDYIIPVFVASENILLGFGDSVKVYSMPDLNLLHADSIGQTGDPILVEEQSLVYVWGIKRPASGDSSFIMAFDYKQWEIADTWIISDSVGNWFNIGRFDIHPDGKRLYFGGYAGTVPSSFIGYDLEEREIMFTRPIFSRNGVVRVSPDGREVYQTDPGYAADIYCPGTVFVYDPDDGTYLCGISLYGYHDIMYPLHGDPIVFTPTGDKVYIGSGRILQLDGTIMSIDTETKQVQKLIWPHLEHFIGELKIGPKL
jgi:WD40 repeat protein